METKIVVTKRFRKNTMSVYQYLLKEFSSKTAYLFLKKIEQRIELIVKNPTIGKLSSKKKNIRSISSALIIYYFTDTVITQSKFFASLICEKIQRKNHINIIVKRNVQ